MQKHIDEELNKKLQQGSKQIRNSLGKPGRRSVLLLEGGGFASKKASNARFCQTAFDRFAAARAKKLAELNRLGRYMKNGTDLTTDAIEAGVENIVKNPHLIGEALGTFKVNKGVEGAIRAAQNRAQSVIIDVNVSSMSRDLLYRMPWVAQADQTVVRLVAPY